VHDEKTMTPECPPFGSAAPYAEPLWYSRNVTVHHKDSHRKLRATVRNYVDEDLRPYAFEWESAGRVPPEARAPVFLSLKTT
jgi:Acyl-CoA dehydrogenase, N-terminal domain